MEKIKAVEPISFVSFNNKSFIRDSEQFGKKVPCALIGSQICPKPQECDGIERKCTAWRNHSSK